MYIYIKRFTNQHLLCLFDLLLMVVGCNLLSIEAATELLGDPPEDVEQSESDEVNESWDTVLAFNEEHTNNTEGRPKGPDLIGEDSSIGIDCFDGPKGQPQYRSIWNPEICDKWCAEVQPRDDVACDLQPNIPKYLDIINQ